MQSQTAQPPESLLSDPAGGVSASAFNGFVSTRPFRADMPTQVRANVRPVVFHHVANELSDPCDLIRPIRGSLMASSSARLLSPTELKIASGVATGYSLSFDSKDRFSFEPSIQTNQNAPVPRGQELCASM
ncbi:uncharacterized protein CIMG_13614 [Coccidioides immitis RS]|uniref:Uncharacterized protein n=1 Tax=Coccidioides immitis (strain RS) TaxID=246410 RepID=A0A0D8JVM9_COCIM|nr:uncharacterized protein CIMG_13614 [Coccidioides immitis RS]KJF61385.1 hypothetical protein CIMG_13614 [Coccidioides immitis RS]